MQTNLIQQKAPLSSYNTFGIATFANYFASIQETSQLKSILLQKKYLATPKLILGGGSNILFTKDFDGLVLFNQLKGKEVVRENADFVWLKVASGENWHDLVQYCVSQNWGGIENLSLIPGTVGAAPIQNIGAYGVELKNIFHCLEAIHLQTTDCKRFNTADCQFAYRNSIFKQALKGQYFITSVTLKLSKKPTFSIQYGAIQRTLEKMNITSENLTIQAISQAICTIRQRKLPDPKVLGNSGSFFKNPELPANFFRQKLQAHHPNIPHYPLENGQVKVPAAWLIEQCGWKGKRQGDAGVYTRHALILVNHGKAKGLEIKQLANDIQDSVWKRFGVQLECEVNVL